MAESKTPIIRTARRDEMIAAARVYLAAFPETLTDLALPDVRPLAIADVMTICQRAEPGAFTVAELDGGVVGYAICPSDSGRIWRSGLIRGALLCMFWHWVTGGYGIGLRAALRVISEKLMFWRHESLPQASCPARILSVAVDPSAQGLGLGRKLTEAGLGYLRGRGVRCVRLEVRPGNAAARHIYESVGFRDVGVIHDTRGPWDVMMLDMADGPDGSA